MSGPMLAYKSTVCKCCGIDFEQMAASRKTTCPNCRHGRRTGDHTPIAHRRELIAGDRVRLLRDLRFRVGTVVKRIGFQQTAWAVAIDNSASRPLILQRAELELFERDGRSITNRTAPDETR